MEQALALLVSNPDWRFIDGIERDAFDCLRTHRERIPPSATGAACAAKQVQEALL
jgi:hypothetical protein